jgi:nifR3 family TIM-barrel protein
VWNLIFAVPNLAKKNSAQRKNVKKNIAIKSIKFSKKTLKTKMPKKLSQKNQKIALQKPLRENFKSSKNFWQKLRAKNKITGEAILALAPMADVTDFAFREMFAKYGKPTVIFTEFVSADGLCLAPKEGREKLLENFKYSKKQRPIVAQIFGANPTHIEKTAELVAELGFDGLDLNMGCPENKIVKQGAGSALIKNPTLAQEIILSAKRGVENFAKKSGTPKIAVSVKTRLGFNKDELETWLPKILETEPDAITLHARTRKEMSLVEARWERVKRAVEIRDELQKNKPLDERTLILGNGDVISLDDANEKIKTSGADGAMIGRGVFGNPWFFDKQKSAENFVAKNDKTSIAEKLNVLIEHTKLFEKFCQHKNFAVMKKHYKAYCHGFDGAKELRIKLMETNDAKQVAKIVKDFLKILQKNI